MRLALVVDEVTCNLGGPGHDAEHELFHLAVGPSELNGLRTASRLMVDKLTTVSQERLGSRIGRLSDEDIAQLNRTILVFLGLA